MTNAEPETDWHSVPSLCAPPSLEHGLLLFLLISRFRLHHSLGQVFIDHKGVITDVADRDLVLEYDD